MFEFLLLFVVIPLRIFPAARAGGRGGVRWVLAGCGAFLAGEYGLLLGCRAVYFVLARLFGWEEAFEELTLVFTNFLDIFALFAGFACAEAVRFRLKNPRVSYMDSPPPPPKF